MLGLLRCIREGLVSLRTCVFDCIYDTNERLGFLSPRSDEEEAPGSGDRSRRRQRRGYSRFDDEDDDGGEGGGGGDSAAVASGRRRGQRSYRGGRSHGGGSGGGSSGGAFPGRVVLHSKLSRFQARLDQAMRARQPAPPASRAASRTVESGPPMTEETLLRMSVGELKRLAAARGEDVTGLVEKRELQDLLRRSLGLPPPPGSPPAQPSLSRNPSSIEAGAQDGDGAAGGAAEAEAEAAPSSSSSVAPVAAGNSSSSSEGGQEGAAAPSAAPAPAPRGGGGPPSAADVLVE